MITVEQDFNPNSRLQQNVNCVICGKMLPKSELDKYKEIQNNSKGPKKVRPKSKWIPRKAVRPDKKKFETIKLGLPRAQKISKQKIWKKKFVIFFFHFFFIMESFSFWSAR